MLTSDFDKNFEKMQKRTGKLIGLAIVLQIIVWLFSVALVGAIVWVAWHFISKYW